jgi:hypothetical protein
MADVVVDVTGSGAAPRWFWAAGTPKQSVSFEMDKLASKGLTMIGVRAHESEDLRKARGRISWRNC